MRLLLIMILLGALGVAGFATKPNLETLRKHAEQVLSDKSKAKGKDDIGDLIGNIVSGVSHSDEFEDMIVASKFTRRSSGDIVIQCWGSLSQFFCTTPDKKK
jgi:hypothetical protein